MKPSEVAVTVPKMGLRAVPSTVLVAEASITYVPPGETVMRKFSERIAVKNPKNLLLKKKCFRSTLVFILRK